ncbi:MAG: peptidoglycan DD-metalloendopeptidase family protein [Clostridia bacterium]|nr:peptidoglycan DD-metalloendopeptidase family protein [Clostridia bacterium]
MKKASNPILAVLGALGMGLLRFLLIVGFGLFKGLRGFILGFCRFTFKVGYVIEMLLVRIFCFALLPGVRFLRKCTPVNIYNTVCGLGERVMSAAVWLWKRASGFVVWAAHSIVNDFCYWAPGFGIAAVIGVMLFFRTHTVALQVTIDGEPVTYVHDEKEFSSAVAAVEMELAEKLNQNYCMYTAPEYHFVVVNRNRMVDEDSLHAQVYRAVTEEIGHHFGLYVDGEFVAATEKKEAIDTVLNELKAPFETDDENARVEFVKNVEVRSGLYGPEYIVTEQALREMMDGATDPQYYTIEEDDLLYKIVKKTGVSREMIYALNPELDERRLIPGRKLKIAAAESYLGVQVVKTLEYDEEIDYKIVRIKDSSMYTNETKVKTAGRKGEKHIVAEVTYVNGVKLKTTILSSEVTREPVTRELYVGTKKRSYGGGGSVYTSGGSVSSLAGSGSYIRPISGGYISCGWYGYSGHRAIDFSYRSGAYGKPIYATAGGTVISAGWRGGYGNMIMIQHSNGVVSCYAHMSAFTVRAGQKVSQGQQIGKIGSTGNSTGPHLHFEIRVNGRQVNPMNYIG